MLRSLAGCWLLAGGFLCGCAAPAAFTVSSDAVAVPTSANDSNEPDIDPTDPAARRRAFAHVDQELLRYELTSQIAAAPLGSQVVVNDLDRQYSGTLLRKDADGVELVDCLSKEVVPCSRSKGQCKTSYVPYQSIPLTTMTRWIVVAPPPPDFAPDEYPQNCGDLVVDEIVFRSGRRQRWGRPAASAAEAPGVATVAAP